MGYLPFLRRMDMTLTSGKQKPTKLFCPSHDELIQSKRKGGRLEEANF